MKVMQKNKYYYSLKKAIQALRKKDKYDIIGFSVMIVIAYLICWFFLGLTDISIYISGVLCSALFKPISICLDIRKNKQKAKLKELKELNTFFSSMTYQKKDELEHRILGITIVPGGEVQLLFYDKESGPFVLFSKKAERMLFKEYYPNQCEYPINPYTQKKLIIKHRE